MEYKEDLKGFESNSLVVTGYNKERSKIKKNAMYNCKCNICGKEDAYPKTKILQKSAHCTCQGTNIDAMRETKLRISKEKALKAIEDGVKAGESKIVAYNESESRTKGLTMVDLICSECGNRYTAPLSYILQGTRYKKCSACSRKHYLRDNSKENLIGKTFGNYVVEEFSHTDGVHSWWKCYSLIKHERVIVNRDTLYQSEKNKLAKIAMEQYKASQTQSNLVKRKIPFTFVSTDSSNIKN